MLTYILLLLFICLCFEADVTAATVGGVHNAEDNVFTTTVATSGSLPEHMLVNQVQFQTVCQQGQRVAHVPRVRVVFWKAKQHEPKHTASYRNQSNISRSDAGWFAVLRLKRL